MLFLLMLFAAPGVYFAFPASPVADETADSGDPLPMQSEPPEPLPTQTPVEEVGADEEVNETPEPPEPLAEVDPEPTDSPVAEEDRVHEFMEDAGTYPVEDGPFGSRVRSGEHVRTRIDRPTEEAAPDPQLMLVELRGEDRVLARKCVRLEEGDRIRWGKPAIGGKNGLRCKALVLSGEHEGHEGWLQTELFAQVEVKESKPSAKERVRNYKRKRSHGSGAGFVGPMPFGKIPRAKGRTSGSSTGSVSSEVHVRGYRKKDGTYVRPHCRSRPR